MIYNELKEYYRGGYSNQNMYGIWYDVRRGCWVKKNGSTIQEYKIEDYVNKRFDYISFKAGFFDFNDVCDWFIELMTRVELKVVKMS